MPGLLSLFILIPLLAMAVVAALPSSARAAHRNTALVATGLQLLIGAYVYITFQQHVNPAGYLSYYAFTESAHWFTLKISGGEATHLLQAQYLLGVDGVSAGLVLLAGVVLFAGAWVSYSITSRTRAYYALYLLLAAAVAGCFMSLDFLLFYICFEFMLLPMYFLIGIWGGERRQYASLKFLIYTLAGSLLILLGMIAMVVSYADPVRSLQAGNGINEREAIAIAADNGAAALQQTTVLVHSFAFPVFERLQNITQGILSPAQPDALYYRSFVFVLLLIGFLVKLPAVPFHNWLPDAHTEAPTPISVVLAGILLKIGGYGLIRIVYPAFPDAAASLQNWVGWAAVLSIVYGGLLALAQTDLKKLIACSSVSHMGFVLLGLASFTEQGLSGAIYQMLSHGFISAALFVLAGVLYERTHNRSITDFGGLAQPMPVYAVYMAVAVFAGLGLPLFSSFIAEMMVIFGSFQSELQLWLSFGAIVGILLAAAYFIWAYQRLFLGTFRVKTGIDPSLLAPDMHWRERVGALPLIALALLFGLLPALQLDRSNETVTLLLQFWQENSKHPGIY